MTAVELSSDAGLVGMVLLTVNLLLGLLLSTRYNPVRRWPHLRIPVFDVHNWTAYIALSVICMHPLLLLASSDAGFRIFDVLWPIHSPKQTLYNCIGALSFYSVVVVVITSYFRSRLGSRLWKKLHYTAYAAAAFGFVHGILIDPNLKNQPPDPLDGEKVLVEICAALLIALTTWRIRYAFSRSLRKARPSVRRSDYEPK